MRPRWSSTIGLLTVAAMLIGSVGAAAEAAMHGRLSHADGSGLVKGTHEEEWSYATVNTLVLPGDTLWAGERGVLEAEFSGGTFLRMADGSKVDVVSLPPAALFRGWSGSFYVQRVSRSSGQVLFESPSGTVEIDPGTQVRIDVLAGGSTTVTVRWGRVAIRTQNAGPTVVSQGHKCYIEPGYLPSTPVPFDRRVEDEFDSWNRDRARLLALGTESVPIVGPPDSPAPIGVADLNSYGEWVYVDDSYFWRPTLVAGYVPYRQGYWSYVYDHGYVWVGYHPFSYVTTHYGYWSHHDHHGWLWSYTPHYSPARVAAIRYGDLFLWAPIDPYGHPVYYGHDHFSVGGLEFSLYASSYAHAADLLHGTAAVYGLDHRPTPVHADDVHIWNVGVPRDTPAETVYPGSVLSARDYSPRRVMRGPETSGRANVAARELAASLETALGRTRFALESSRTATGRRVSRQQPNADGTPRPLRLERASLTNMSMAIERTERFSSSTRRLMARRPASRTLTNQDASSARSVPVARSVPAARSTRPAPSQRTPSSVLTTRRTGEAGAPPPRSSTRVTRSSRSSTGSRVDAARPSRVEPARPSRVGAARSSSVYRSSPRPPAPQRRSSTQRSSSPSRLPALQRPSTSRITAPQPRNAVAPERRGASPRPQASFRHSTTRAPSRSTVAPAPRSSRPATARPSAPHSSRFSGSRGNLTRHRSPQRSAPSAVGGSSPGTSRSGISSRGAGRSASSRSSRHR